MACMQRAPSPATGLDPLRQSGIAACREKIWDHAAGVLIFEEAGGRVTDAAGAPLDFCLGRFLDGMRGGIVAAAPSVHTGVIDAIAASGLLEEWDRGVPSHR